jgi:LysM repeat protein
MVEDKYEDGHDMMDIDFSGLNQGREGGNRKFQRNPGAPGSGKSTLLFAGAALLIILVIIAIVYFTGNGSSEKTVESIQARVKALEEKTAPFDELQSNVAALQQQGETLRESVSGVQSSVKALKGTLDTVSREVALLNKKPGPTSVRENGPPSVKKERASKTHPGYHVVQKGESFYRIAKRYGISVGELCRLNNMSLKSVIHPGQKLLVTSAAKK